jgi:hypothetical protein
MLKSIASALVGLGLIIATSVGITTATTVPAQASCTVGQCGDIRHFSPDAGANGPITITCNLGDPWNSARPLYEGQYSTCRDTDGFYVPPGESVSWYKANSWGSAWQEYAGGSFGYWVKVTDLQNAIIVKGGPQAARPW